MCFSCFQTLTTLTAACKWQASPRCCLRDACAVGSPQHIIHFVQAWVYISKMWNQRQTFLLDLALYILTSFSEIPLRGFYALRAFSASLWCPSVLQGDVGEASCVLCPQHLWIIFCPSTLLPWKALRLTSLFSGCTDAVQGAVNLEGWISGTYLVHFKVVISNFCTDMLMQYE